MGKEYIISVDLGGTKILSALINKDKQIIDRTKVSTDVKKGPENLVQSVAESIKELLAKVGIDETNIKAIALGVPGTVNPESGIISVAPNLQIENFNIKKEMEKYFNIPLLLENDVNMAALGIKYFEYKNTIQNGLVVFLGTGIGGGLIFNGQFYRGSSFFAGEIGHMKVRSNGYLDGDGEKSTFENLASRTAIVNNIIKKSEKRNTVLKKIIKEKEKIKSKNLQKAIEQKDELVIEEIEKACKIVGTVLGSITTLLNLDTIVLGGGLIEANEKFMMEKIDKAFNNAAIKDAAKVVNLKATKLGDDAPLYGGYALVEEFIKDEN
ncbi:MAG: ROK family protein [Ignavibacteriae bacterium]|nr:ROK family protein [Ignavibacteriota bacterium]